MRKLLSIIVVLGIASLASANPISNDYKVMSAFAEAQGFVVTSTIHGHHNKNSDHYKGKAIDVRTRDHTEAQIQHFIKLAEQHGFHVRDERHHPKGQKVWGGPHLHLYTK